MFTPAEPAAVLSDPPPRHRDCPQLGYWRALLPDELHRTEDSHFKSDGLLDSCTRDAVRVTR
jgi:hypothetical protein